MFVLEAREAGGEVLVGLVEGEAGGVQLLCEATGEGELETGGVVGGLEG